MPRPARPWFRFYSELLESRKAQDLGRSQPELFVHWVNLLCLANVSKPRGRLPVLQDVAFALRLSEQEAEKVLSELRKKRFIDRSGNRHVMHDWDEWQYESDARLTSGRITADSTTNRGGIAAESPRRGRGRYRAETEADPEAEGEADRAQRGEPATLPEDLALAYEERFGELQPKDRRTLSGYAQVISPEWIKAAIDETAAQADQPGFPYLNRILRRVKTTGKPPSGLAKTERRRAAAPSASAFKQRYEQAMKGATA